MTIPSLVTGLTTEELERVRSMGVSSDGVLGGPREWDGKENGFDEFCCNYSNWLGGLRGSGNALLDHAVRHGSGISATTMTPEQMVIAPCLAISLKSMVSGMNLGQHQGG